MKNKRFITIYEREIKEYRDKYYKNIIFANQKTTYISPVITFLIPLLISCFILLLNNFSITSYIIAIISLIVINILIYLLYTSKIDKNDYLETIRKYGYHSIEEYEKKLKKYITGPNGYYNNLLLDLKEKYNINTTTKKITTINNEEYYIWSNKAKDKIYLLNTYSNQKPTIKTIQLSDIRYYRVDKNKNIILKTNNELYTLKPNTINIFYDLMKEKRLENIKKFDPETHINDYEIYMHKVKKELNKDNLEKKIKYDESLQNSIYLLISIIILVLISNIIPKISNIINIINCLLIILLNISIINILNNKTKDIKKSDNEIIKELNSNPENIERFKELKYALGISDTYDKVYTKEGAEYLTWLANGYFHVFLNFIYFNSVYMAVKTKDVKYFKVTEDSCDVKLKDKTLEFTKDAQNVFNKLLHNKDYNWVKNLKNK